MSDLPPDQIQAIATFLKALNAFTRRETDICPHCGEQATALEQVERCVYVLPCGCRLYQGEVPEAWTK